MCGAALVGVCVDVWGWWVGGSVSVCVSIAQSFNSRCQKKATEGDDAPGVMLCLLCGELVCTNSFCCQRPVPDDETISVGGLNWHSQT